eukprot:TRINITY_DN7644_c0_g1_i1.p1 TRINITY_DN7644_c0_g1~~TRINITY_DN7644_c0_g1_i1.p1  ORF type:complete len:430 (-),score=88.40 TRINITY_DN7644_c0_g1_i1:161-1315(-)
MEIEEEQKTRVAVEDGIDAELTRLYRKVNDHYEELVERRHSAEHWSRCFRESVERKDFDTVRTLRCIVQDQTKVVCRRLCYILPDRTKVEIAKNKHEIVEQAKDTNYYFDTVSLLKPDDIENASKKYRTTIRVYQGDCLDAAIVLVKKFGLNPLILNMASATTPGGGYKNGAGAQEENLFRRTNLLSTLADVDHLDRKRSWHYPLAEFGGVYSPRVLVFRGSEADGYPFFADGPLTLGFVAVAAYRRPTLVGGKNKDTRGTKRLSDSFAEKTKRKIRAILNIALLNGHDSLVLSALGCGAYQNPPDHIAQLFREVLFSDEYANRFSHVVFAIFDDHNSRKAHNPDGNVQPFIRVFGDAETTPGEELVASSSSSSSAATNSQRMD